MNTAILFLSIDSAVPFCLFACLQWSVVSSFATCDFFLAAFAFQIIHFGGLVGSAVALVSVDSFRLVLFVVSSKSAYIKYFHKITCNIATPIDVTHLLPYVKLLLHSLMFALAVSAERAK